LLTVAVALAWAMNVGVTGAAIVSGTPLSMQLVPTVDGLAGSASVSCATTTDRVTTDDVHATPENTMDVLQQLCPPPPTGDW
jgi:hypothetical protein